MTEKIFLVKTENGLYKVPFEKYQIELTKEVEDKIWANVCNRVGKKGEIDYAHISTIIQFAFEELKKMERI